MRFVQWKLGDPALRLLALLSLIAMLVVALRDVLNSKFVNPLADCRILHFDSVGALCVFVCVDAVVHGHATTVCKPDLRRSLSGPTDPTETTRACAASLRTPIAWRATTP